MSPRSRQKSGWISPEGNLFHWRRSATVGDHRVTWTEGIFETREAAERARAGATRPTSFDWQVKTWADWTGDWLPRKCADLQLDNGTSYAKILVRHCGHLVPRLGDLRMVATTTADITDVFTSLRRQFSETYVTKMRGTLVTVWRAAQAAGMPVVGSPIAAAKVRKDPVRRTGYTGRSGDVRQVDPSEALLPAEWKLVRQRMVDLIESGPTRQARVTHWALPVLATGSTGARRSETLGLQVHDVDLDLGLLRYDRQVTFNEEGQLVLGPLKTDHSYRTISIGPNLVKLLADHIEANNLSGDDQLFACPHTGGLLHPDSMTSWVTRQFAHAGVHKHCTPHILRHTHATILLMKGVSDVEVAARLGHHSSSYTRNVYARFRPRNDDGIGDLWEEM